MLLVLLDKLLHRWHMFSYIYAVDCPRLDFVPALLLPEDVVLLYCFYFALQLLETDVTYSLSKVLDNRQISMALLGHWKV